MAKAKSEIPNPDQMGLVFDFSDTPEIDDNAVEQPVVPAPQPKREPLYFMSLGSGSSGNCCYVGCDTFGVLIDAGVDPDKVFESLKHNGVKPEMVKALLLTHDHGDHVRYAYKVVRKYKHIRIYCTPKMLTGMLRRHSISSRVKDYHQQIWKEIPFKVSTMEITAFEVQHDGTDNCGYLITCNGRNFVISPDQGQIVQRSAHYMSQAEYLMVESNYDNDMLTRGEYPEYLKNRIRNPKGHLDNVVTAEFVAENYSEKLKYVFLAHLSADNNTPDLARTAMTNALTAKNISVGDGTDSIESRDRDLQLVVLPRFDSSAWFVFND